MQDTEWAADLTDIAETARIDNLPEPVILTRERGRRHKVLIGCLTDTQAAAWEVACDEILPRLGDDNPMFVHGRIGRVVVKIATIEDLYFEHVASALLTVSGKVQP